MKNNVIQFSQITVEKLGQFIEEKVSKAIEKLSLKKKSEEKSVYTRDETARLLDVSLTTLFHWNNQGILKAKKIGKRVYYSKTDVQAHLNQ
ncbi:helix-turn-helix domain-containing protein [Elizabethkingia anophelis]|nr:helix-turn-helix domain-containing protein [Elizabethkingia anophelis]MCT4192176.1 helix-turn-helix domain-containing protein [Elizabethkingia anophelis]MCT4234388.1 helix-turn-helix domain-containing protein [Elizabethkingia anophelis]MDV3720956.1 DNA-binding protein [Elizabethkingia anophelis]MDV3769515.1 DNA-binding protein [Elizabethkingia anophelis]